MAAGSTVPGPARLGQDLFDSGEEAAWPVWLLLKMLPEEETTFFPGRLLLSDRMETKIHPGIFRGSVATASLWRADADVNKWPLIPNHSMQTIKDSKMVAPSLLKYLKMFPIASRQCLDLYMGSRRRHIS